MMLHRMKNLFEVDCDEDTVGKDGKYFSRTHSK